MVYGRISGRVQTPNPEVGETGNGYPVIKTSTEKENIVFLCQTKTNLYKTNSSVNAQKKIILENKEVSVFLNKSFEKS